ncbi:MAG: S8 family peptidase, partial [Bdellovibrionia bacterium]
MAQKVHNEVLVKLKGGIGIQKFATQKPNGAPKYGQNGAALGKYKVKESLNKLKIHRFELTAGQSVDEALADLGSDPDVEYAEPNYIFGKLEVEKSQTMTKSDLDAMALANGSSSLAFTLANIQTSEAWGVAHGSEKPIIAIIDSGSDASHEILRDALWTNPNEIAANGVDDDHNGYVDDIHGWNFVNNTNNPADGDGHGTHVAGIVRGVSQDIFAWPLGSASIQIMTLKFLDDNGSGSTADAVSAIYYAVNNGAKILNNSWGGTTYSRALHEAIAFAYQHEVLFIAAAGNAKSNNDSSPMYPANYDVPNVLSVAATNDYDSLASFSNFGVSSVHIASPGVSILSSYPPNSYT